MITKTTGMACALALLGALSAPTARADDWNKKTTLTFSQAVEVAGHVLPAGTYTFQLMDSLSDRNIVQISNADGSKPIAIVMAIPDSRAIATGETVVKFSEVPAGSPEAIRSWFYPGDTVGQAFVYPKARALALARASKVTVPALAVDVTTDDEMKAAALVGVSPDAQETPIVTHTPIPTQMPIATQARSTPPLSNTREAVGTSGVVPAPHSQSASSAMPATSAAPGLPRTASVLPSLALAGLGAIGLALGLMWYGKVSAARVA